MKEKIVLIGGGGHCNSVIDVIELENKYEIIGIVDDNESLIGKDILGYKVIGTDKDLPNIFESCKNAVITVGQITLESVRVKIFQQLKEIGFQLPVIVSPLAYISRSSNIGEGTVIMHHSLLNSNSKVGANCIINTKALIEHDAVVGDNCHISTGAILNGGTVVKDNTFFGSNAVSKQLAVVSGFVKAGSIAK
jgi:sugar O-acyltransferase (sialic acid O-acetyltransferase NeuD family)